MGLDMYLNKKHYIGNKWKEPKDQVKLGLPFIKDARVSEITEQVGYWRKANQIHKWFVDNVQDGNDDCKEYYVSREKLQELLDLVIRVLELTAYVAPHTSSLRFQPLMASAHVSPQTYAWHRPHCTSGTSSIRLGFW